MPKHLIERWGGDLRRLREEAERDPGAERNLLEEFKGVGDVGVDIFFREVQAAWGEVRPFLDRRARSAASRLGLPDDPAALADLVPAKEIPRLVSALVRVDLDDSYEELKEDA